MGTKHLQGGKKLGLDWDRVGRSDNHNQAINDHLNEMQTLRQLLVQAEREGKYSKAKKLRRQINHAQEVELMIRHTFCGACHQVLHNCQCEVED